MAPNKLKIIRELDPRDPKIEPVINVMFNPNSYSITKSVTWSSSSKDVKGGEANDIKANAPTLSFGGGGARQLSLDLFYDVTESPAPLQDVRFETDKIVKLTRIVRDKEKPRPPVCTIEWGGVSADFPFTGVVSSLLQNFTLFHQSGRPLRAQLHVVFTEFLILTDDLLKTDPELTTRIVRRGDTLPSIAAEVYRNPTMWRAIAQANRIEDPLHVPPGTKLTLPKR